jgi:hypothetical protein
MILGCWEVVISSDFKVLRKTTKNLVTVRVWTLGVQNAGPVAWCESELYSWLYLRGNIANFWRRLYLSSHLVRTRVRVALQHTTLVV